MTESNSNIDNNSNINTTTAPYQPPIIPQTTEHKTATADKAKAVDKKTASWFIERNIGSYIWGY